MYISFWSINKSFPYICRESVFVYSMLKTTLLQMEATREVSAWKKWFLLIY